jgi:PAS domain S-box-containing protein
MVTIDSVPGLVALLAADGQVQSVNRRILEYTGQPLEELRQWATNGTIHDEDLPHVIEVFTRSIGSGTPYEILQRLRRHDGEYRWFQNAGSPLRDPSGSVVGWCVLLTDIDERRRGEVDLKRAYDSFAEAQRLSHTGNFTADIAVDEHVWSEELYRIFEFDPAVKIAVQDVRAVIHPDDLPSFDAGFARSLRGSDFDQVFRIVTRSGRLKYVRSLAHLDDRVAGRPVFIGAIQDVTENKITEEALNRARADLAHVTRVTTLSTLTASITHEINQPLSGIMTNAGTCLRMLNASPPNIEGARETTRRAIRDGNRASEVITRLRALFSRREFTLESLNLNEAIREVIALSLSELQRSRIVVEAELSADLPTVMGDRVQLQQVLLNLLRNAADAMLDVHDRSRQLTIRTEREDGTRVRVTVHDTGVGLDAGGMDKLFQAFHSTKAEGMGIGLSISRSIIESHHGRIWAEAHDGPGATFAFSIPCDARP